MKKFLAIILAVLMCMTVLVACSDAGKEPAAENDAVTADTTNQDEPDAADETSDDANEEVGDNVVEENATSDLQNIKDKGVLVVGITDFAPMDYQDADGNWIGFDADLSKAFAQYLGVDVKFQLIDWDNKALELQSGTIDVVWNGMTLTDEVKAAMECSNAYCNNAQVIIVPAADAEKYVDIESVKDLSFAVESGSAGAAQADAYGFSKLETLDQATALLEVMSGTADAAIIDSLMAGAMVGEGTSYADLTYILPLNSEEYGVGFRKGSDAVASLNEFFVECYVDGTMMELAELYGVDAAIIPQF